MPNIASLLKSEIARVARKEVKAQTAALKKSATRYRSEIATLKRELSQMHKVIKQLAGGRKSRAVDSSDPESEGGVKHRFSAKRLAGQRKRLALSAQDLGLLLGASGQSVYHWEQGKSRPRASQLPAIAALRTLGKKDAAAIVESRSS